jgi:hypothetical protein
MRMPPALLIPIACLAQDPAARPVITFNKTHHDFGKLDGAKKVTYRYRVANTGKAYLNITQLNPSCGCTSTNMGKWSLAPGESTEIEVAFDPKGFKGVVRKSLQVVSDDPATPTANLTFEAEVIQEIMPSTGALFFLGLQRTERQKQQLRLASGTDQAVQVLEVKAPGAPYLAATWRSEGKDVVMDVELDGRKVPPGQMNGVDTLSVRTPNPRFSLIPINVQWEFKASVVSDPERVAWVEKAGTPLTKPFTLSQVGGKPFRILDVKATRDDIVVEGVGKSAAASHALRLVFRARSAGNYNEAVTFHLDDPDQPELRVRVSAVLR